MPGLQGDQSDRCPECHGAGRLEKWKRTRRGVYVLLTRACTSCQGTGKLNPEQG